MFNSALLALAATASLVVADDFKRTDGKGSCNVGDVKVCTGADFVLSLANNSLVNIVKDYQEATGEEKDLIGLNDIVGQIGIECSQIPILGVALQDMCKVTPVCCEKVEQNGLINLGCSPLSVI
ncbi:hypothetical protein E3P92_00695 [Wallemia ichthyophaga]|uniref:Hydrophobin n=1 Tax=Wallemia ichthyophaga TaxID=245174 RepID=A0A4T0FXZ8_WALIC|nr:hypothetical protein E3P97_00600 [Wallemia ichthyophaga]TIA99530.1 hypothetical protein E3P96_02895 [Wallemia ichthyophaga]TIB18200.1 hypothetical protein E3P92_00695 [Wallemia ichthyophaga]TIB35283.1 hypothetical protein E3P85_00456 [Wallemia ichthyophaga]TIB36997.1 hypothetical protein E3P86_02328 [Wallemia ichthyophaga]